MKALSLGMTIGILGGGQLARMLSFAAARLGFRTIIFAPEKDCAASKVVGNHIIAAYTDQLALDHFSRHSDVITYESENVPIESLHYLASQAFIAPHPKALEIAQDRFFEKKFLNEHNLATAPWWGVEDQRTLIAALTACGGDGLLKTRRFGYDGKGQVRVTGQNRNIARRALDRIDHVPAILEGIVDFSKEISMIAARGYMGDIVFFDIPENFHKYGILQRSVVPANLSSKTVRVVQEITRTILQALHYVGVIAVEFFVDSKECVYVNEFAPRVHNSGHWTEAACVVSQFEQHIRAIAGWPLGSPLRHSDCVMQNLIGNDIMEIPRLLEESGTFVHHYGKEELRSGRKMGHVIYLS